MIDKKVIDGHIIPNRVMFTAPARLDEPYPTLAFEDNLKVTITFFTQNDGKHIKRKPKTCVIRCVAVLFKLYFLTQIM